MIQNFDVKVLMGDFNMALFLVIPELRSRGVTIDLAAWYPWKSAEGVQMADSCGIFFIDTPGEYTLCKGLKDLHDNDSTGILWKAEPVAAGDDSNGGADGFHRMRSAGGPGMPLRTASTLPVVGVKVQTHAVACWELLQRAATDKRPAASCSAQPQTTAS
jgi:hypothetical protein